MSLNKYFETKIKRKCFLRKLNEGYEDVELKEGENSIGRSRETQIADTFCSKNQLILNVNLDKCNVEIKVNGANASGLNGFMITKEKIVNATHGDIIDVLYGKYIYKIEFEPQPESNKMDSDENNQEFSNGNINYSEWDCIDDNKLVVYTSKNCKPKEKIAGYDLDWTIIKTKSGNVFPKGPDDWEIMLPEIPKKLKILIDDDFKICFFTNQSGIGKGRFPLKDFKRRIESIRQKLNIPLQVFISTTSDGFYRKPLPGMWTYLKNHKNGGVQIDDSKSFYVGDAAGRPEIQLPIKRKRDHSSVDRLFAYNIGLSFFTPEEHFQNKKKCEWVKPEFEPKIQKIAHLFEPEDTKIPSENCEVIILVGLPGSGKSTFSNQHLKSAGYEIINADTLGNVQKCLNLCDSLLKKKQSCVIDNTNIDVDSRKKLIELAQRNGVKCRCFLMNTTIGQVKHNLKFRILTDSKHSKINDMVFNSMKKKYVEPKLSEGFSEIVKINLLDGFLKDPEQQKLYKMYLLES